MIQLFKQLIENTEKFKIHEWLLSNDQGRKYTCQEQYSAKRLRRGMLEEIKAVFFFFFFPYASPPAYGSSQTRSLIWSCSFWAYTTATAKRALTHATTCSNARSLNRWVRPWIKPASSQILCEVLNLLSHNGNSRNKGFNKYLRLICTELLSIYCVTDFPMRIITNQWQLLSKCYKQYGEVMDVPYKFVH